MQPLLHRVGFDLQHHGDLGDGQLLPRAEPEHLGIRSTEASRGGEDQAVLVARDRALVRGGRRAMYDGDKAILEPTSPCGAAPDCRRRGTPRRTATRGRLDPQVLHRAGATPSGTSRRRHRRPDPPRAVRGRTLGPLGDGGRTERQKRLPRRIARASRPSTSPPYQVHVQIPPPGYARNHRTAGTSCSGRSTPIPRIAHRMPALVSPATAPRQNVTRPSRQI